MEYLVALAIAAGFATPLAVWSAAVGQGLVGRGAVEAMARQPEIAPRILTAMIMTLALIESIVIFSFLMAILLFARLPDTAELLQLIGG